MSKLGMMCGLWAGLAGAAWGQNLLCNGGFESPQVGADSTMTDVPCWQTSGGQKIELQRKSAQYASGTIGNQHVELDVNTNSDIYQDVATVPGQRYLVRFRMANRTGSPRSAYRILWDGAATGTALRNSTETTFVAVTAEVVATKTVSRIGFAADGPSDGVGDLLDDVTLVPIPAAGSRLGYTYYFPHYANGGGWVSSISILNTSPTGYFAASVEKTVFGDDGTELEARQTITLSPAGSTMIESVPTAILKTGWVRLVSSEALEAAVIFRSITPGRLDIEASVLSREPTTETVAPFDNAGFATGFAVTNPGSAAIVITFVFRGENGVPFSTTTLPLGALAHTAFTFAGQFPQTAGRKGSVLITAATANGASAQFVPLGLRFTAAGAFTTLPY